MDDNTSIQFRLRLAQINGIKLNEDSKKDHVTAEIDYDPRPHSDKPRPKAFDNAAMKKHGDRFGVTITRSPNAVQDSDHNVSGPKENVKKFLVHHYGDKDEARENHPEVFRDKMNEQQIDEVKRSSGLMPKEPATEDQRAPTLKTYHSAMAKYSHLPPRSAHIKALNDTIDKHGLENANEHVTRHFYSHMQKHLSDD
jgi:hypothetical protein